MKKSHHFQAILLSALLVFQVPQIGDYGPTSGVAEYITNTERCNIICNVLIAWLEYAAISRNVRMCCVVFRSVRLLFVLKNASISR